MPGATQAQKKKFQISIVVEKPRFIGKKGEGKARRKKERENQIGARQVLLFYISNNFLLFPLLNSDLAG